jgi:y4mF family transcriptional regulator
MLLRRPNELAGLFRDGRKRAGWSQTELAEQVGVSRQWVSLVETGKTSVEFDLVLAALQALGYGLFVEPQDTRPHDEPPPTQRASPPQGPSSRTALTRNGEPLGRAALGRRTSGGKKDGGS